MAEETTSKVILRTIVRHDEVEIVAERGEVVRVVRVKHDALDDLGIEGLVRIVSGLVEEVQS